MGLGWGLGWGLGLGLGSGSGLGLGFGFGFGLRSGFALVLGLERKGCYATTQIKNELKLT